LPQASGALLPSRTEIDMFVQVFQGKLNDPDLWASQVEKWRSEIRPKTTGFLGFTSGVTADDYAITVVRFDSQAKAQVDSNLAEQGAWFEETTRAFDGEIVFHDYPHVDILLAGGSDQAGFVQVMQGRAIDQQAMRDMQKEVEAELRLSRPDLIGAVIGSDDEGGFTQASYFTSEHEARINEKTMADSPLVQQFMSNIGPDLTFYDLTRPEFA
jgi:hypothetical protein